ncbi:MAG: RlmE family RNA methyltransferase [Thermoplasmata archaeon]|nr:RlmE family RNA methyltransferase [Thermoplasmata archaeon]
MSKSWTMDRKKDYYYKMAKEDNYRSRAAYKLFQMDERFKLFRPGDCVIDLGANPGGWSQVASELVGESGMVISLDIKPIEPIPGVKILKGDARSILTKSQVKELLAGKKAYIILSDMAPNISGNYSMDHARSIELAEMSLEYAKLFLKPGGSLAVKVFDGDMARDFFIKLQKNFRTVKRYNPKASRKSSSEIYYVAKGFK